MTAFKLNDYALFIGLDVGKSEHHATALTRDADKIYDKALPNSQEQLQHILTDLVDQYGPALLAVDQPSTIGALPVAVAQKPMPEMPTSSRKPHARCPPRCAPLLPRMSRSPSWPCWLASTMIYWLRPLPHVTACADCSPRFIRD